MVRVCLATLVASVFVPCLNILTHACFAECLRQGVIGSYADVQAAVEGYSKFHMYQKAMLEQMGAAVEAAHHDVRALAIAIADEDATMPVEDLEQQPLEVQAAYQRICDILYDDPEGMELHDDDFPMPATFGPPGGLPDFNDADGHGPDRVPFSDMADEQQAAINGIKQLAADRPVRTGERVPPIIAALSGGPGTGKTTTVLELVPQLMEMGLKVLVVATTAAAVQRLRGLGVDTIDSVMMLRPGVPLQSLPPNSRQRRLLEQADVIICDEMSMLTSAKLMFAKYRLSTCTPVGSRAKLLVLVGDHAQLPPVCRHTLGDEEVVCSLCHIMHTPDWSLAHAFHLRKVHRQAGDLPFLELLNDMRYERPTQQRLDDILGGAYRALEQYLELLQQDTTTVCSHLVDVRQHNLEYLLWAEQQGLLEGRVLPTGLPTNAGDVPELHNWLVDGRHDTLPFVAVGARVLFTENVDKARGMVNSGTGVVTDLVTDDSGTVTVIKVRVDSTGKVETVRRGAHAGTTYRMYFKGTEYYKRVFPLQLAYAITAHRCQGMTLHGHVILHIRSAFAAGITYVMLSRVPSRDRLIILGGLKAEEIVPVPLRAQV